MSLPSQLINFLGGIVSKDDVTIKTAFSDYEYIAPTTLQVDENLDDLVFWNPLENIDGFSSGIGVPVINNPNKSVNSNYKFSSGKFNSAIEYNPIGNPGTGSNSFPLGLDNFEWVKEIQEQGTIEFWFMAYNLPLYNQYSKYSFMKKEDAESNFCPEISYYQELSGIRKLEFKLSFGNSPANFRLRLADVVLEKLQWNHLEFTWNKDNEDADKSKILINGVRQSEYAGAGSSSLWSYPDSDFNNFPVILGGNSDSGWLGSNRHFIMDNLKIYKVDKS